jgi:hypothetical protein
MLDHPEPEADDRWANVAESISAAQNPEFGKMN